MAEGLLDLGTVRMKPAGLMTLGQTRPLEGELAIRLKSLRKGEIPGIDPSHTWAWAVVFETKGDSQPDGLLEGGSADSETGALAMATQALMRCEARRAIGAAMTTPPILEIVKE